MSEEVVAGEIELELSAGAVTAGAGATGCSTVAPLVVTMTGGGVAGAGVVTGEFVSVGVATGGGVCVAGWPGCPSSSLIFCSNVARAAACAALSSSARAEIKLAQTVAAQIVRRNLEIRITFSYVNFSPDATAFPVTENRFRHAGGNGLARIERAKIPRTSPRATFTRC